MIHVTNVHPAAKRSWRCIQATGPMIHLLMGVPQPGGTGDAYRRQAQ
jgi:hypothetical protein